MPLIQNIIWFYSVINLQYFLSSGTTKKQIQSNRMNTPVNRSNNISSAVSKFFFIRVDLMFAIQFNLVNLRLFTFFSLSFNLKYTNTYVAFYKHCLSLDY